MFNKYYFSDIIARLNQKAIDSVAFKNQSTHKTLRQYVWAVCQEAWEQDNG